MAFEGLTERLQNAIGKLRRKGKIGESDVKEVMREIRLALLEADVNFKVVKALGHAWTSSKNKSVFSSNTLSI